MGGGVERTWLAGLLWPDSSEALAAHSLRTSLADLRRALDPEAGLLRSVSRRALALDLTRVEADVLVFDGAVARGDLPSLEETVAVYRGPLLDGCTDEWVFQERQSREQAYLEALETLADHALAHGKLAAAEQYLRRAAVIDPLRERVQRELIRALAAGGSYAAALQAYRELRLRLHHELNAEPDPETQRLFQEVRAEARAKAGSKRRSACEVARDYLPDGTGESEPGERRRKHPTQPESRIPIIAPDRPAGLTPPASRNTQPNNLPQEVTSFVGRTKERAEVRRLLSTTRLLTVTGSGGTGKTRLSLQVAAELLEDEEDGVWLSELAPLRDPMLVLPTVATTLGLPQEQGTPLSHSLVDFLKPRRLLLLLDNCEHLLSACADLAGLILRNCPRVRIMATSREGLNVAGETTYPLLPLSMPDPRQLPSTVESLAEYDAVKLLIDRAAAAAPSFTVTDQNALAVALLCVRLDGIPLAIELAAARVRALSVEQISQRLNDRFRLLTRGRRTAPPRHQTLKAAIDWSYDLLSGKEQVLLRRLSVFAGGWTLEAAERVCADPEEQPGVCAALPCATDPTTGWEVLDLLSSLVDKSLVLFEKNSRGSGRYRLLETVRQYARDRLQEAGEAVAAGDRHLEFFTRWAEEARGIAEGGEQTAWFDPLEKELDNLRAALEWSAAAKERTQQGLRLMVATQGLWVHEHCREGRERLMRLLEQSGDLPDKLRADALMSQAWLEPHVGEAGATRPCLEQSRILYRALDDPHGIAATLLVDGIRAQGRCELSRARSLFEEARLLSCQSGNGWAHAWALLRLGEVALADGYRAEARAHFEQSLAVSRDRSRRTGSSGWSWVIGEALGGLAAVAVHEGDLRRAELLIQERLTYARANGASFVLAYALVAAGSVLQLQGCGPEARARCQEGLALARTIPDPSLIGNALCNLASLELSEGSSEAAAAFLREALMVCRDLANRRPSLRCLEVSARWAHAQGRPALATRLLSALTALRDKGGSLSPVTDAGAPAAPSTRAEEAAAIKAVRAALGETAFVSAWMEGQMMRLENAIKHALDGLDGV